MPAPTTPSLGSLPPRRRRAGASAGSLRHSYGNRHSHHGHVSGDEDESHRQHGVGIGAHPTEEAQILHEDPVSQAERHKRDQADEGESGATAQQQSADGGQDDDGEEVDRPPVGGDEGLEGRDPRGEEARLRRLGHCADHAGQRPAVALPEPSSRPRLQHGHPDQEHPAQCEHDAAQTGGGVGPFGQSDEDARRRSRRGRHPVLRRARSPPGRRCRRRPRRRPRPRDPNPPTPSRRTATTDRVERPAATGRSRPGSTRWPTPPGSDGSTRWWRRCSRGAAPSPGTRWPPAGSHPTGVREAWRIASAAARRRSRVHRSRFGGSAEPSARAGVGPRRETRPSRGP